MITTEKIKAPGLSASFRLQKRNETEAFVATQPKENRITKGRRVIKRLKLITDCVTYLRVVILFAIAAIATSALLNIFLKHQ